MNNIIKKGDVITIEGLNQSPDGRLWFNTTKKQRRVPLVKLMVKEATK